MSGELSSCHSGSIISCSLPYPAPYSTKQQSSKNKQLICGELKLFFLFPRRLLACGLSFGVDRHTRVDGRAALELGFARRYLLYLPTSTSTVLEHWRLQWGYRAEILFIPWVTIAGGIQVVFVSSLRFGSEIVCIRRALC